MKNPEPSISHLTDAQLRMIEKAKSACRRIRRGIRREISCAIQEVPQNKNRLNQLQQDLSAYNDRQHRLDEYHLETAQQIIREAEARHGQLEGMEMTLAVRITECRTPRVIHGSKFVAPYEKYNDQVLAGKA